MNPEKKQQSPWKSSLIIGACAVIASITLLAIWCIPISISWRIILSVIQIIFIIVLLLHQTITHWEQLARRRTAITLQTLGSLLVIQVVATQALRVASTSAKMFVKTGESTFLNWEFVITLTSTSVWFDLSLAILGFAMLLSVLMFTKTYTPKNNKHEKDVLKKNEPSVNVNVTQIVNPSTIRKDLDVQKTLKYHLLDTYDSDLPPLIDIWVGREPEIELFREIKSGVIVITGIGGQGKSTLAAKSLELYRNNNVSDSFWMWRDCKEQADSFRTQLVSVIECYTRGIVTADKLDDANVTWLSKFFFKEVSKTKGFIVFDNVDHYVDVESSRFISDVSSFVQESLRVDHNFIVVFTCRPRISYPSVRFREVYLRGFEYNETRELFCIPSSQVGQMGVVC